MPDPTARALSPKHAADSVFSFVERTAEQVPGGVRWKTLTYENEPQYDLAVFWGSGGIPFFLADYYRLTGTTRALDLAIGGAQWCSQPERLAEGSAEDWRNDGLLRGRAGVGMAWVRIAQATGGDAQALKEAAAVGDYLLQRGPGPHTDWLDGATGEGLFLLRLGQTAKEARFLDGARRWADWLASVAVRNEHSLYWPWEVGADGEPWYGLSFVPGAAGAAYFLLLAHQESKEQRFLDVARQAGETLRRQAAADKGGLNWPDTLNGFDNGEERKCQLCYGAPGVGVYFTKAYELFRDPQDLETAEAAGECTYQYGDRRKNAVQCHGLAAGGELLIDLYNVTGKQNWLDRAHEFGTMALAYRHSTPAGDEWQADDTGYYSPEFSLGASGTGHFFLRLWQPKNVTRPLL